MQKYKVLTAGTSAKLQETVNQYLKNGYLLSGGPSIIQGSGNSGYYSWESYANSGVGTVYVSFMQAVYKETFEVQEPKIKKYIGDN